MRLRVKVHQQVLEYGICSCTVANELLKSVVRDAKLPSLDYHFISGNKVLDMTKSLFKNGVRENETLGCTK